MYLVKAENSINNDIFATEFTTESAANEWLQRMLASNSFGKPARQVIKGEEDYDQSLFLSEFEDTDEFGTRMIVSLKAEYTVEGPTLIDGSGSTDEDKAIRMRNAVEKAELFKKHKGFGETVQLYFTSMINERSFTQAQKDSVQVDSDVLAIMQELNFGRIGKAKSLLDAKNADETLFFSEDLSTISKLMEDFLAENQ